MAVREKYTHITRTSHLFARSSVTISAAVSVTDTWREANAAMDWTTSFAGPGADP